MQPWSGTIQAKMQAYKYIILEIVRRKDDHRAFPAGKDEIQQVIGDSFVFAIQDSTILAPSIFIQPSYEEYFVGHSGAGLVRYAVITKGWHERTYENCVTVMQRKHSPTALLTITNPNRVAQTVWWTQMRIRQWTSFCCRTIPSHIFVCQRFVFFRPSHEFFGTHVSEFLNF